MNIILTILVALILFVFISASLAITAICLKNRQIDREMQTFNELIEEHSIQTY